MANNKIKVAVFLSCVLAYSLAAPFACKNSSPKDCRAEFIQQFDAEFKDLHVEVTRNIANLVIGKIKEVKQLLPRYDARHRILDEAIKDTEKALKIIEQNKNDNKKIAEGFHLIADNEYSKILDNSELRKMFENLRLWKEIEEISVKSILDIGRSYLEMYKGLNTKDLEAYTDYKKVYELMTKMINGGGSPREPYAAAAKIFAFDFQLPYVRALGNL